MFDSVSAWGTCPRCGEPEDFECQTKDLKGGNLYHFRPLPENWIDDNFKFGRAFRSGLPVFPKFPYDKSASVWTDQAERMEAAATIPKEFWDKLNFVSIVCTCPCGASLEGKLAVKGKFLWGPLYDLREESS